MTEIESNTSYPVPSLRVIPRDEHGLSRKQMTQNAKPRSGKRKYTMA